MPGGEERRPYIGTEPFKKSFRDGGNEKHYERNCERKREITGYEGA